MRLTERQLTDLEKWAATDLYGGTEKEVQALVDEVRACRGVAQPLDAWTEEDGPALWWKFPIEQPPYSGTPLDDEFSPYFTHWTPIVIPAQPELP